MTGMTMPQQTWYGAAAGYLGMWMAMMVPMMLPSLVPMLSRYRRSVRGAEGIHLHGLTALVGVGYFVIWAVLGVAALGVRCSLCCGSLMLALLAIGMMDLVPMAAVTLAISAERLTPVPLRVARVAGVAMVVVGVLTIARV